MNSIVTDIQLNGNDTVSFYNGTTLVRTMSRIIPSTPNFFSYRYDTITIEVSKDDTFSFQIYPLVLMGTTTYTALNFNSTPDVVEAKTAQAYLQLTTLMFDSCCDCSGGSGGGGSCAFQFELEAEPLSPFSAPGPGNFYINEQFLSPGVNYELSISEFTYGSVQDIGPLYPVISVGSWIYLYSTIDPTNFVIFEVDSYISTISPAGRFNVKAIAVNGRFDGYGTKYCVDFTAGAGISNQDWQQTLDQSSTLTRDNLIKGGGFNFSWESLNNYELPVNNVIEVGNWDTTLINPNRFEFYADGSRAKILATDGTTELSVIVQTSGIKINTPDVVSSTALPGYVLKLQADGTAEFEEATAGTGTVQSVGLSMPSAFSLNGTSPITTTGTFNVTATGTITEYIDGTGALQTLPVYIAESGLNNLTSPLSFRLGGTLLEDATISTDGFVVNIEAPITQAGSPPLTVSNLGTSGLANFYNYAQTTRNPVVISNQEENTYAPLLLRNSFDSTSNNILLSLNQQGLATDPTAASVSIEYNLEGALLLPASTRLTSAIHTYLAAPNYRSVFNIETAWSAAGVTPVLSVLSTGQIKFNAYVPSAFQGVAQSLLAVNSSGEIVTTGTGGFIVSVSGTAPISVSPGINPVISMAAASPVADGYLSSTTYNTFNNKQDQITLTTIGTSGAATFVGNVLNIPQYAGGTSQAGSGLSQVGNIINLGRPDLVSSDANPLTQNAYISVGSFDAVYIGNQSKEILRATNTRTNSIAGTGFRAESDGGNSIEAVQNFTGTITGSYIGKTAAFSGTSNVGYAFFGNSQRYTTAYFELFNSFPVTYPALHVVKDDRQKTATYDEIVRVERQGTGTASAGPQPGFGGVTSYWLRYAYSPITSVANAGSVGFAWIDPAVQTSEFIVAPTLAGTENIRFKIKGSGQAQLPMYTSTASFPGTAQGLLGFDTQGNIITVTGGGGGGGSINGAYNGLSVVGDQIVLGGPLTGLTTISSSSYGLHITGDVALSQTASLYVNNTNTGANPTAIKGEATGSSSSCGIFGVSDIGRGVIGTSNQGVGVIGVSTSGIGGSFVSQSVFAVQAETNNNSGNTIQPILVLNRNSSSAAQTNLGGTIDFSIKTSSTTLWNSNRLVSKWTDVNEATRTSQFEIHGVENALNASAYFTLKGTGQVQFNKYNNPSVFNGAVSAYLAVDAFGNVIQTTGGGGGGGITGLIGDVFATGPGTAAATIQPGVVTYSKIQNVAANTFLANATGSVATVQEISTSRIPLFSSSISGTPSTNTFLRGDGSWSSPISDGDRGDITVSALGNTWTIDNAVVTYAKFQNVAANSFLANVTGSSGTVQEISTSRIPLFASAITGTPSGTTYLRGDGTWAVVSSTGGSLATLSDVQLGPLSNAQVLQYNSISTKWENASIGALTDGNKGDITVSSGATVWTINNNAVTYAKLQAASATQKIIGTVSAGTSYGEITTNGGGIQINGSNVLALGGSLTSPATVTTTGSSISFTGSTNIINRTLDGVSYGIATTGFFESTGPLSGSPNYTSAIAALGTGPDSFGAFIATTNTSAPAAFFRTPSGAGVQILSTSVSNPSLAPLVIQKSAPTSAGAGSTSANRAFLLLENTQSFVTLGNTNAVAIQMKGPTASGQEFIGEINTYFLSLPSFVTGQMDFKVVSGDQAGAPTLSTGIQIIGEASSVRSIVRFPAYTSAASVSGTAVATLGVSSSGQVVTLPVTAANSLASLSDVQLGTLSNGQVLQYNSTTSKWVNATIGALTDGDKGDITVSGSGATWTIDNTVVTYAKIQNVAANSFLANITGSAASVQEISTSRIPLFASAISGTPSATNFLRGDGSWQTVIGLTDGDKGDITVSGSGATWTIDANAVTTTKILNANVTYAKLQLATATQKIIGTISAGTTFGEISTGVGGITIDPSNQLFLGGNLTSNATISNISSLIRVTGAGGSVSKTIAGHTPSPAVFGTSMFVEADSVVSSDYPSSFTAFSNAAYPAGLFFSTQLTGLAANFISMGTRGIALEVTQEASSSTTNTDPCFEITRIGKLGESAIINQTQIALYNDSRAAGGSSGFGSKIQFFGNTNTSGSLVKQEQGNIAFDWVQRGFTGNPASKFTISVNTNNSIDEGFRVYSTGSGTPRIKLSSTYGVPNGVPGTATAGLAVTSSGELITTSVPGASPLTTKGDLYTFSTTNARLPVGTNGQFLSANSATATGLQWTTAPAASLQAVTNVGSTTTNSILVGDINTYYGEIQDTVIGVTDANAGAYVYLDSVGAITFSNGIGTGSITSSAVTNVGVQFQLPNKATGTHTLATTADITGGGLEYAIASGTNAYTATISGVTAYTDGDTYAIKFTNGNDDDSTININGLGAKTLVKQANITVTGGDIVSGQQLIIIYDGTNFQCLGVAPNQLFAFVTNDDTVPITKGQVVYAAGAVGNRMSVKLANNTLDSTSAQTVGVVFSSSIAVGEKGFIITQGVISGVNTAAFNPGDQLYLGPTAGSVTATKPVAPNHLVYVGIVERANAGQGQIYIKPQNGYELEELHDVSVAGAANNDYLYRDTTVSPPLWKSRQLTASLITDSTTVGQNLVKLTNPSQISYLRVNANNTVDALTVTQLKSDLGLNTTVLSSNVTNSDAAGNWADITGLSFSVVSGATYKFKFTIIYSVSSVVIGSRWAINGPAFTSLAYRSTWAGGTITSTAVANGSAYDAGTVSASTVSTSGNIAIIEGIIRANANGTVIGRLAPEATGTVTANIGSYVEFSQIA
jgi:hypothetical protein